MPIIDYFKQLFIYAEYCSTAPMKTLVCYNFWVTVFISGLIITGAIFLKCLSTYLLNRRLYAEHEKWLADRAAIADEETMNKYKWKGETQFDDLSQEELAERMRNSEIIVKG